MLSEKTFFVVLEHILTSGAVVLAVIDEGGDFMKFGEAFKLKLMLGLKEIFEISFIVADGLQKRLEVDRVADREVLRDCREATWATGIKWYVAENIGINFAVGWTLDSA